jgi:transglutaminase/protease-like cytokinesis protein 3
MDVLSIVNQAKTIEEKAKVIYDWICDNIAYDTTKQIHDAEICWTTKRGVCQAYSELFCYMAEAVGLTADIIVGKTKNPKGEISTDKHAWVFVYTDGYDGIIIDPTWGAGGVDGVKFVKKEDNSMWFNVSPYWMIFSHFPDNPNWTKLDIDITEEQFKQLPYINPSNEKDGKDTLFESLS